jgi:hypothetical protein
MKRKKEKVPMDSPEEKLCVRPVLVVLVKMRRLIFHSCVQTDLVCPASVPVSPGGLKHPGPDP